MAVALRSPKMDDLFSLPCSAFGCQIKRMIMTPIMFAFQKKKKKKFAFSEHSSVYLLVLFVFHNFWDLCFFFPVNFIFLWKG
jgi:hypothetical protein